MNDIHDFEFLLDDVLNPKISVAGAGHKKLDSSRLDASGPSQVMVGKNLACIGSQVPVMDGSVQWEILATLVDDGHVIELDYGRNCGCEITIAGTGDDDSRQIACEISILEHVFALVFNVCCMRSLSLGDVTMTVGMLKTASVSKDDEASPLNSLSPASTPKLLSTSSSSVIGDNVIHSRVKDALHGTVSEVVG